MTQPVRPIELLRRARDRISEPKRWCAHTGAIDRGGLSVDAGDENAVRWCALGAIGKEAADAGLFDPKTMDRNTTSDVYPGQWAIIRFLNRVAGRLHVQARGIASMQDVNDRIGREAAIRVFDDAIKDLEHGLGLEPGGLYGSAKG